MPGQVNKNTKISRAKGAAVERGAGVTGLLGVAREVSTKKPDSRI